MPVPLPSRMRSALVVVALLSPALVSAQGRAGSRVDSIVVTASSVRVRTGPSMQSLSIDEFGEGSAFPLASEEYFSRDFLGIVLDGRIAFVPRYAVALKQRAATAVQPRETAVVAQAGAAVPPAPAPTRQSAPEVPAPVAVAAPTPVAAVAPSRQAPMAASAIATAPAPAPVSAPVAASAPAPAPASTAVVTQAVASSPVEHERVPERLAAREPESAPKDAPKTPPLSARRIGVGLTLGLLASVTPVETSGLVPTAHVAGLSFLGVRYRGWGVYLAPEYGTGGRYQSTMVGGGLSRDLLDLHLLRVTAMAGYTTYSETPIASADSLAPAPRAAQSFRGTSLGGMASIPLVGPLRVAFRGQYVMGQQTGIPVAIRRYSFGLVY